MFSLVACQAMDLMTTCIDRYTVNISSFYSRKMSRLRNGRTILRSQITIQLFHLTMRIQIRSNDQNTYRMTTENIRYMKWKMQVLMQAFSVGVIEPKSFVVRWSALYKIIYIYIYIYMNISSDFHICQIWIWFKELARYFCRIWTSLKGKYRT